ncbi:MAG: DNA gyrase inhibitor, partial [Eubacteriaceae bacterium]|nr:DNA gyrase inhibitor [Eubacteriaceae bacterium]
VIQNDFIVNDRHICRGMIDGGKYAVVKIPHTAEDIKKAWEGIFPELLKQGFELDMTRPVIERYATMMIKNNYCEICVPIK